MPKGIPIADWNGVVLSEIKKQLDDFKKRGFPPTLRGMYYTLVDRGIIPKTEAAYGALSGHTSRWRENDILPIDCFADNTRRVIEDFNDVYETIEDYIQRKIYYLENTYDYYDIPRWYKQPKYVEIWLEKDAAVGTFRFMVKDRHVRVVPNRGHSSVAFFNRNVERLKQKQAEGKTIHIRYFGDLDPSGEVMDKIYKRKFAEYGLYNVDFKRLAVTGKQMKKFHLLHDPDPETLRKLKRDSNKEAFKLKYGLNSDNELFAIQIEAMQAPKVRAYLKRLVLKSLDALFDENIYRQVQAEKPTAADVKGLVRSQILGLL